MSDLPTPTASRVRAPSWRDSRLLVGLLLVLLSTVLGSVVVARADDRVPVYAAKSDLAPGQKVTESDVVRVDVLLGDGAAGYLPADRPLADDTWSLRALRPGELIPVSGVGPGAAVYV
jgi:flagella basal body P-ring formation protein FlgA